MRYAIGSWVLDTDVHVLTRRGREVTLEPKAVLVLECLAAHAGEAVSRARLAEAAWPRQQVTDQTINRVIHVIRKVFGDDPAVEIRTVHRKGYRLQSDPPVRVLQPLPLLSDKSSMRWLAPILLALVVGLLVFAEPFSSPDEPATGYSVGLIPVQPRRAGDEERLLTYNLNQVALLGLRQDERLDVIELPPKGDGSFDAWLEAQEGNLPVVLVESVLLADEDRLEDHLRIRLHRKLGTEWLHFDLGWVSLPSPVLDPALATAARASYVGQLHYMIAGLLGLLPFQAGAGDLEAFRLYLKAIGSMQSIDCSDVRNIGLLESAVERSPHFLQARLGLAEAHFLQVWSCGQGRGAIELALEQVEAVLVQAPEHAQAVAMRAYLLAALGRAGDALDDIVQALDRQPEEALLHHALSYLQLYVGDLQGSLQSMQRALALDPLLLQLVIGDPPSVYFWLRDWQALLDHTPRLDSSHVLLARAWAQWRLGDEAGMRATFAMMDRLDVRDRPLLLARVLQAVIDGDREEIRQRMNRFIHLTEQWPILDGEQLLVMAVVARLAGYPQQAERWRQAARANGFVCDACEAAFLQVIDL